MSFLRSFVVRQSHSAAARSQIFQSCKPFLAYFDPVHLYQAGFQTDALFAGMVAFVQRKYVRGRVTQVKAQQDFLVFIDGFLAAGDKAGCLFTCDRNVKTDVGRIISRTTQCIYYAAEERAILMVNWRMLLRYPMPLIVRLKYSDFADAEVLFADMMFSPWR